ncbi:sestrin-like [Pelomyxa schiedti]|nr:sestrin-like [Pelomyxa schiedti]
MTSDSIRVPYRNSEYPPASSPQWFWSDSPHNSNGYNPSPPCCCFPQCGVHPQQQEPAIAVTPPAAAASAASAAAARGLASPPGFSPSLSSGSSSSPSSSPEPFHPPSLAQSPSPERGVWHSSPPRSPLGLPASPLPFHLQPRFPAPPSSCCSHPHPQPQPQPRHPGPAPPFGPAATSTVRSRSRSDDVTGSSGARGGSFVGGPMLCTSDPMPMPLPMGTSPPMLIMSSPSDLQPLLVSEEATEYNLPPKNPFSSFQKLLAPDANIRSQALRELELLFVDTSILLSHLHTIVRLVMACPFDDVSTSLSRYLACMPRETIPTYLRPSRFYEFSPSLSLDAIQSNAFIEYFGYSGSISNLDLILSVHLEYFEAHCELINTILRLDNPLPRPLRHYVAILAASRRGCEYLVHQQEAEFRQNKGPEDWLVGVDNAPPKVQAIVKVIAILANKPWTLKRKHIDNLGQLGWSIAQIVTMIIIACEFISLSSVVFGCGINPEFELSCCTSSPDRPHDLSQTSIVRCTSPDTVSALPVVEPSQQGLYTTKYLCGKDRPHVDFNHRTNNLFRGQDYCWSQHGYGLVEEFCKEAAPCLHKLFDRTLTMACTRTEPFREAVWHYVHRIHGITHDDYEYQEVNCFILKQLKLYIKKVIFYPSTVTCLDFDTLDSVGLRPDEKVGVCLLALEAQKQACLLYGLYAVMMNKTFSPSSL